MIDALHAGRPAEPAQPILVAEDGPEAKSMRERCDPGIPIHKVLLAQLRSIAQECGAGWPLGRAA